MYTLSGLVDVKCFSYMAVFSLIINEFIESYSTCPEGKLVFITFSWVLIGWWIPPTYWTKISHQAQVVWKADNALHRINHYLANNVVCFVNTFPLDSNLSSGQYYPAFEQLHPDFFFWHALGEYICTNQCMSTHLIYTVTKMLGPCSPTWV